MVELPFANICGLITGLHSPKKANDKTDKLSGNKLRIFAKEYVSLEDGKDVLMRSFGKSMKEDREMDMLEKLRKSFPVRGI